MEEILQSQMVQGQVARKTSFFKVHTAGPNESNAEGGQECAHTSLPHYCLLTHTANDPAQAAQRTMADYPSCSSDVWIMFGDTAGLFPERWLIQG